MKRIAVAIFLLAQVASLGVRAAQPLVATLELVPDSALPGTPVAFRITFLNPADTPQTVVNGVSLNVDSSAGTFTAKAVDRRTITELPAGQMTKCHSVNCLIVPAHSQRELYIDVDSGRGNDFFNDSRLSVPGTYDLRLTLFTQDGTPTAVPITTNVARLTIRQPSGSDADAWQFLKQVAGGHSWTFDDWAAHGALVANDLTAKYPTSAYAAWFALLVNVPTLDARLARIDAALALTPPASLRDDLLLARAWALDMASEHALLSDRNVDQCLSYADMARAAYTTLQQQASSQMMKQRAAEGLTHINTRTMAQETLAMYARSDPPAPGQLQPKVECVTGGSGSGFTARFGYTNPNKATKVIQVGDLNQVTPAPHDQGQPRVFAAGAKSGVFTARSPGGQLIWHLDGGKAVASADFPVRCSAITP